MASNTQKRRLSDSPVLPTTPSKRILVNPPTTSGKGKPVSFINRVLMESSRPIPANIHPRHVEYPPFEQFSMVFSDGASTQFLRLAVDLEEYDRRVKYFHGRLVLLVRGLHLHEVEALYHLTVPAWHETSDGYIQEAMTNSFDAAYDWANEEVLKKVKAYSRAWFDSVAGQDYINTWNLAK